MSMLQIEKEVKSMARNLETIRSTVKGTSGTNIAAGLWLIAAPFVLTYTAVTAAMWNAILVGLAVLVLAWVRVAKPLQYEGASWTNVVLGLWMLVAPFALGYTATTAAMWNDIIVGLVVAGLGTWSALASRDYHPASREHQMTS